MRAQLAVGMACVALLALAPIRASAVTVTAGNPSGIAGQLVDVNVSVSSVTGLNIVSYQFGVTFNGALVSVSTVDETGTLSGAAGWGPATFSAGNGTLSVSHAGTTPLTSSGILIKLRFLINPAQLSANSTGINFSNFTFNEGTPAATTVNGSITINTTPVISVYPNSGEIVRGQTLAFNVSGSVSNPVTWGTTDPTIATINGSGLLTGVAPGSVRVFAQDNAGLRDTTDSVILVRGMAVTVGSTSVLMGQPISVPVTTTSLTGLGIRSGQLRFSFNPSVIQPVTPTALPGSILNGYAPLYFSVGAEGPGTMDIDFAGASDLAGSGTLFNLNFVTVAPGGSGVGVLSCLFNETLPAIVTGGSIAVTTLPVLTVSPSDVTLLAGQTQAFGTGGAVTPPVTWSTLDPSVATINSSTGVLTAVGGGVTKVKAVDNVGATGFNNSVTVYDFKVTVPNVSAPQGGYVTIPISLDRDVSGLKIYSMQYTMQYPPTWVLSAHAEQSGLTIGWAAPAQSSASDHVSVADAGIYAAGGTMLNSITFHISPSAPISTFIPLTLTGLILNEGLPSPQVVNGSISVISSTGVAPAGSLAFALEPAAPNPVTASAHIAFTLPEGSPAGPPARLAIYSLDGRRVRTLAEGGLDAGRHDLTWDVRDDAGHPVHAGLYFMRLDWDGQTRSRRFAVVR